MQLAIGNFLDINMCSGSSKHDHSSVAFVELDAVSFPTGVRRSPGVISSVTKSVPSSFAHDSQSCCYNISIPIPVANPCTGQSHLLQRHVHISKQQHIRFRRPRLPTNGSTASETIHGVIRPHSLATIAGTTPKNMHQVF